VAPRELEPQATLHSRRPRRAGRSPSARLLTLCAAAAATALVAAAAAESKPSRRLDSPSLAEIARAQAPISDALVSPRVLGLLAPGTYWGGAYRTRSGESVTVYASNAYPVDPVLGQRWADFLGSLLHGPELSSIRVFLAPESQVSRVCGSDAVACYSSAESALLAPGQDPSNGLSAEAVIAHEYGHHVAANRSNAPWAAVAYGPKRWASAIEVCARARRGELAPGAEDPVRYDVNPGEGWAETYRLLNERRRGVAESPWGVVSNVLYPDAAALAAAEQDVTSPWVQPAASSRAGTLTRSTRTRTYTIPTQLDGTLKVTLRPSAGTRVALDVFASSTRLVHAVGAGTFSRSTTVCGQRSLRVRVSAVRGSGGFRLAVATP
jgi:hypothetical protein